MADILKNIIPGSIERSLLKRHVGPFVFCFLTIMFLLLMQFLIQFMDHLVGKGIPFTVIIELIMVNLAYMVVLAVPMTILAASLMAYGKFSEQNEYTAVRAAGIHPFRIIRPALGVAIIITLFLGWFSNEVLPEANYKARALFLDIRMKKPGFDLQENTFYEGIEGYTFLVRSIPPESDTLHDITLFQNPGKGRDRAVIKARNGLLESNEQNLNLTLRLYDGTVMRYLQPRTGNANTIHEETTFESYRISFDLSDLTFSRTNPEDRRRDGRSMSAQAMMAVVDSLKRDKEREIQNYKNALKSVHITFQESPDTVIAASDPLDGAYLEPHQSSNTADDDSSRHMDHSTTFPPMDTIPFAALHQLNTLQEQRKITSQATSLLRNNMAIGDNLMNNLQWREERIARFVVEIHKKASIPVACILFALIGAPLGLLMKKGNMGIHTLISTVLFTYYWISIIQGEKLANRLIISPLTGMWFPNFTMAVAAAVLLYLVIVKR